MICKHPECNGVHTGTVADMCPAAVRRKRARSKRYTDRRHLGRVEHQARHQERASGGLFVGRQCDHPECNGKHASKYRVDEACPGEVERRRSRDKVRPDAEEVNEVMVAPGYCVAWLCNNPAEFACEEHAPEFLLNRVHRTQMNALVLTDEDLALRHTMPADEWERVRKAIYRQRKREQRPDYVAGEAPTAFALRRAREVTIAKHAEKLAKRRETVLNELQGRGWVSTSALTKQFGLSSDSLKRLFRQLEAEGLAERIYGGLRLPGTDIVVPVTRKAA